MTKLSSLISIVLLFSIIGLTGCSTMQNRSTVTVEQQRQEVLNMKTGVLSDLYALKPSTRVQIKNVPGYAVFSNKNVNLILASFSGGYGVVKNNLTGKHTFMNMGEVGVGLGLGVKDYRLVFIFHTKDAMQRFTEQGWSVGVQGDAAAKLGDQGAAIGRSVIIDNVTIYQITENGLALQANIKGTKYWKNNALN